MWITLGPTCLRIGRLGVPLPWPWLLWRTPVPRGAPLGTLHVELDPTAGREGDLELAGGRYAGPGFWLTREADGHRARVADASAIPAAIAAFLVDVLPARGALLLHAAVFARNDRAHLVLGRSGSGKSSFAARHSGRVLGSNSAVLWANAGGIWAAPLPITGKGDAAVRPIAMRVGALWSLEQLAIYASFAARVARIAASVAVARGGAPPRIDVCTHVVAECALRRLHRIVPAVLAGAPSGTPSLDR